MLFAVSLFIIAVLAFSAIWFRNKWVIDTFNSYGVCGAMAGYYLYRRFGLWYRGEDREDSKEEVIHSRKFGLMVDREADMRQVYKKEVKRK